VQLSIPVIACVVIICVVIICVVIIWFRWIPEDSKAFVGDDVAPGIGTKPMGSAVVVGMTMSDEH
jgi:hypothetical protein